MNLDSDARNIWEFNIGISINDECIDDENDGVKIKETFKNFIFEITDELTKISEGLTYNYCYGTWLDKNTQIYDKINDKFNDNTLYIERNISVNIFIIILPELSVTLYNSAKTIISNAKYKYNLDISNVQAIKSFGYAKHFTI